MTTDDSVCMFAARNCNDVELAGHGVTHKSKGWFTGRAKETKTSQGFVTSLNVYAGKITYHGIPCRSFSYGPVCNDFHGSVGYSAIILGVPIPTYAALIF